MSVDELLECALAAAQIGADELMNRFRGTLTINTKTSVADYVTDADLASETAVRNCLKRLRPNDSISGEEYDTEHGQDAKVRWSIDPLDGTVNFARGIDRFATSVAAVDIATGQWLAGAVIAPAIGDVYYAKRGGGAFRVRAGETVQLFGPPRDREARILVTGFSYSAEARAAEFAKLTELMPEYVDMRRFGSAALDICHVAEGTLDAYYQVDIKEHDWAAAMLIAEEAGLEVTRPKSNDDLATVYIKK